MSYIVHMIGVTPDLYIYTYLKLSVLKENNV